MGEMDEGMNAFFRFFSVVPEDRVSAITWRLCHRASFKTVVLMTGVVVSDPGRYGGIVVVLELGRVADKGTVSATKRWLAFLWLILMCAVSRIMYHLSSIYLGMSVYGVLHSFFGY